MLIAWLELTCRLKMEQNNSECFSFDLFFTTETSVLCSGQVAPFVTACSFPPAPLPPLLQIARPEHSLFRAFHSKRDRKKPSELENWAGHTCWQHLSASEQTLAGLQDFACSTCVQVNSSEGSLCTFMHLLLLVLLPLPWLDFS